jgi:hypothetical protein
MKQTMQLLKCLWVFLLVELLCWQVCFAQVDPWERIKLMEQGKKISVKLNSGRSVNGQMEAWSTDGLSVRQGKDKVTQVAKSEVARVAMPIGMSRGRRATYAGVFVGGGLGALVAAACASQGCDGSPAALFAAGALLYGGIAAGIAAIFPQHKEVIYTSAASAPGDPARR